MKIACFSFTDRGNALGEKIKELSNIDIYQIHHYPNSQVAGGIKQLLKEIWHDYEGFIFISATGIAVRMISTFIEHKSFDPAIVVIDDLGKFSISLLSGHLGGANEIAKWIGEKIDAIPVITTASDNRGIDSIDMYAKTNNYFVEDMDTITKITSMMVNGKRIGLYTEEDAIIKYDNLVLINSLENVDSTIDGIIIVTSQKKVPPISVPFTILRPKNINIGIGCRKGIETKRIIESINVALSEINISTKSIKAIGTVEVKKDETGIIEAAKYFNCPLRIFTIDEIKEVEENFSKSQFVKDTIGVYSVSEPSAYLLGGKLIKEKSMHNGITISISK